MKKTYDEKCPHCGVKLGSLHDYFVRADYATEFVVVCPMCRKLIEVNVESVPEFALSKLETKEEYQAKLKRLQSLNPPCVEGNLSPS